MASVSKQFTAFTILQLQQEGLLKLSDPVRKYIPELGAFANDITLYQLLTHTSGIRDFIAMTAISWIGWRRELCLRKAMAASPNMPAVIPICWRRGAERPGRRSKHARRRQKRP